MYCIEPIQLLGLISIIYVLLLALKLHNSNEIDLETRLTLLLRCYMHIILPSRSFTTPFLRLIKHFLLNIIFIRNCNQL